MKKMKLFYLVVVLALLAISVVMFSGIAHAGAAEDIKAGDEKRFSGNYDEAIRLYTKAIASGELPGLHLGIVYSDRGQAWEKKGNYDKAIADYTKAIELGPRVPEFYDNRGNAWRKKRDYDKAIADFTKAIEIDPQYAFPYLWRGHAWYDKGDYDKAITDYTKGIELVPLSEFYRERGFAWEKKGDYANAITDLNKYLEDSPNAPDAAKVKKLVYNLKNKAVQSYSAPQTKVGQAGAVPDGFIGIPWGAGRATVEKAMAERYYPKDSDSKADVYIYNGEFAGYKADLVFRFINNKVYEGTALFLWHEPNKWRIDQYFSDLEAQLIQKYGNPKYRNRDEGGVPWNPWGDYWTLTGQNTTIDLSIHKQYEYISRNPRDNPSKVTGNVNICYTNTTLKEQEEKRAKDKDL